MDGSEKKEVNMGQRIWNNGTVNSADEECWFGCNKQMK